MNTYEVKNKTNGELVYVYRSQDTQNTEVYPLGLYDHTIKTDDFSYETAEKKTDWLIDIGPFFDRFGAAKLAVLISTDPMVQAIVKDTMSRKWIDLKRPEVAQAIDLIASKVSGITPDLKEYILTSSVSPIEQVALMVMYGEAINNGN
jgi:hypothetical protein